MQIIALCFTLALIFGVCGADNVGGLRRGLLPHYSFSATEKNVGGNAGAKCSRNQICNALGLTGECCPTSDNKMLDCCSGETSCSAHSGCDGLEGECCPARNGKMLSCCFPDVAAPVAGTPPNDNQEPTDTGNMGSCSSNPICRGLGLKGDCCPTKDGVFLECCVGEASCSAHTACSVDLGLAGTCCPTKDGTFLDCCKQSCDANPGCAAKKLDGACCPTMDGEYLDCCDYHPDTAAQAMDRQHHHHTGPKPRNAAGTGTTTVPVFDDLGASCKDNPVCALVVGEEGACCPNEDGDYLPCCNRKCVLHSQCMNNEGSFLDGQCCPTVDGVGLECCDHQAKIEQARPALCKAYEGCRHLSGACCPPVEGGEDLDCCSN